MLAAFFVFGATMSSLTIFLLLVPGTAWDRLWKLNPEAQREFSSIGLWAVSLMAVVAMVCALCAIGLWQNRRWGLWLATFVLAVNLVADTTNAAVRRDYRTLVGVPIAGTLIFYLARRLKNAGNQER